jgi:hypothetical protein
MKTILAVLILATSAFASPPGQFTVQGTIAAVDKNVIYVDAVRIALADPPTLDGRVAVSGHPLATQAKAGMSIACVVRQSSGKLYFFRAK